MREIRGARRRAPLARTGDAATSLPSRWDSREKGWVSSVKSQGSFGTCWAFASLATLETQLLRKGLAEPDFSEKNLVNLSASSLSFNDGGNFDTAAGCLLRWSGPVTEANDPYVTGPTIWTDHPSPALAAEVHVRDVVWIPRLDGSPESREILKEAIAAYGTVGVPVHWRDTFASTNTYYCHQATGANHAVTVVGWDDAYPTNAFKTPPPGEGAWIIKNSWGRRYGDQGFYHVSYYDQTFGKDSEGAVFLASDDDARYSAVHGHDCGGPDYWSDAYDAGLYARDTNGWALCIKAYTSNTASVPAEDAPDLVDNGAAMLRDLAATHPALYAETFSFDALSALAGANGRSLWASWLAGLDPGDPDDAAFTVSISITNGAPCISWDPDLGDSRSYTVWGRDALDSGDTWRPVDPSDPGATGARFFKVSVGR